MKSSIFRSVTIVAVALIICLPVSGQPPSEGSGAKPGPGPAPNARQIRPQLPAGVKPRAGHGECLLLPTAGSKSEVVRLHCALDPYAMVMLPTGELKLIEAAKAKPTTDPFVAATPEQMIASLKSAGFAKYKFEQGNFYLYAYDCSDGFYMHARSILESMLPGIVASLKSWGLKVQRPDTLMAVVIMPSRAAFDALKPMPPEVAAYYNIMTNHIIMYEDQELWEAAPEFAAKQGAYTISHEGVHQLLANIGVQNRLSNWSPWICEGLPEYYCPLKVNSRLIRKGNAELPDRTLKWNKAGMVNDLRMWSLLKMNAGNGDVVKKLVEADEIDANGYALAWGLVHYLATKKPDKFQAFMAELSKYEPLDPTTRSLQGRADALFNKHFGTDYAGLEREIQGYLTSKPMQAEYVDPIENQTHYVVRAVQKVGRAFQVQLVITTSPAAAKKWRDEQASVNDKATYSTKICKTRGEAERQVQKLQSM